MTKKDFVMIAETIKATHAKEIQLGVTGQELKLVEIALSSFAQEIANKLGEQNPRFDTDRFLDACGDFIR